MKKMIALFMAALLMLCLPGFALADEEIAYASTPLNNSSSAKVSNIELAASALDGTLILAGETFSFNDTVGARTADNGYQNALNGRGVKYRGGGVAQVATTLYLALKDLGGDIRYVEKKTYGDKFADDYVFSGEDAIIVDSEAETDFRFVNNYGDMSVSAYVDGRDVVVELLRFRGFFESDMRGSATTQMIDNRALRNNVELCVSSINDTTLGEYDEFSFNDIVGPRSEKFGYEVAINGRGVKVVGGGVAQVASTVWLAIKDMDDIEVLEKKTYGKKYNQSYVSGEDDAILTDYASGEDFRFRYIGEGEITIYAYVDGDRVYAYISDDDEW